MAKMISVLAAYGLSYVPEAVARGDAGSLEEQTRTPPHILMPEIDQFVTSFSADTDSSSPRSSTTASKKHRFLASNEFQRMVADRPMPTARPPFTAQLIPNSLRSTISREIAIEMIRRQQAAQAPSAEEIMEEFEAEQEEDEECADGEWSAAPKPESSSDAKPSSIMDIQHSNAAEASSAAAGIVQRCSSSAKVAAAKDFSKAQAKAAANGSVRRDFFGNILPENPKAKKGAKTKRSSDASGDAENVQAEAGAASPSKKARNQKQLKYKFQKGFTNAIRRPVLLSDLM